MMDDQKMMPAAPVDPVLEPQGEPAATAPAPAEQPSAPVPAPVSAAVEKFKSCRWRATPEDGVLPFAGKEGFVAESWCPDCAFYKLRRTPKKRERLDFTY
jgi:hypothetical protein